MGAARPIALSRYNDRWTLVLEDPGGEPTAHLPHGRGQRVLVVDNETSLVALAEEILAELGYEPVGFSSSVALPV